MDNAAFFIFKGKRMNELINVLESMDNQHINKRMDFTTASFDHIKDLQRRLQGYSKRHITTQSIVNLIIEHHAVLMKG